MPRPLSNLRRQLLMRFALVVLMLVGTSVAADTEIYRCVLEDGTFAFQETPCPEPIVTDSVYDVVL